MGEVPLYGEYTVVTVVGFDPTHTHFSPNKGLSQLTAAERICHIRQSRPDSGLGFQAKVLENFQVVPSSLGSGLPRTLGEIFEEDP